MNRIISGCYAVSLILLLSGCTPSPVLIRSDMHIKAEQLMQKGVHSADKGAISEAENSLKESLKISSSIEDNRSRFKTGITLARLYRLNKRLTEAEQVLNNALEIPEQELAERAEAEYEQSLLQLAQGRPELALASAQLSYIHTDERKQGRCNNLISRILLQQGSLATAKSAAESGLAANTNSGMEDETANSLYLLGEISRRAGEYQNSINMLLNALTIDKKLGIPKKIHRDLTALAETAQATGATKEAEIYQKRAKDVLTAIGAN